MSTVGRNHDNLDLADDDTEVLKRSELYPPKELIKDDPSIQLPFQELWGESLLFLGRCGKDNGDVIGLSTYRLAVVAPKQWFIIVPVGMILAVEAVDARSFAVRCKDGRSFRVEFVSGDCCWTWLSRLQPFLHQPAKLEDFCSFPFLAYMQDNNRGFGTADKMARPENVILTECDRLGFSKHPLWRISDGNTSFELCKTYPRFVVVPTVTKDDSLRQVREFRSQGRFPAVVWRHAKNGAVLARCSQPMVGWLGYQRCIDDEQLVSDIARTALLDRLHLTGKIRLDERTPVTDLSSVVGPSGEVEAELSRASLLLVDMRTSLAAMGNRTRGGGTESKDYYPCIDPVHHDVPNIHSVKASFDSLAALCSSDINSQTWLSQLESTNWLAYLSGLLKSACQIAHTLDVEGRPVIVHCSDGWDRTSQATALVQLLLDPYYRTFKGFQTLIEKEWLLFGHKFASRCGQTSADIPAPDEFSPIFLQWLDAAHQVARQFPTSFEFSEGFLVQLSQHVYSRLFGTFLCNNERERVETGLERKTVSVWEFLREDRSDWKNHFYQSTEQKVLKPRYEVQHLAVWSSLFQRQLRTPFSASSAVSSLFGMLSKSRSSSPMPINSDVLPPRSRSADSRVTSSRSVSDLCTASLPMAIASASSNRMRHHSEGGLMGSSYENVSLGSSPCTGMRGSSYTEVDLRASSSLRYSPGKAASSPHVGIPLSRKSIKMEEDEVGLRSNHSDIEGLLAAAVEEMKMAEQLESVAGKKGEDSGCPSESSSPSTPSHPSSKDDENPSPGPEYLVPQRFLDGDGLPRITNAVQLQMNTMEKDHRREVEELNRKVSLLKEQIQALTSQLANTDDSYHDASFTHHNMPDDDLLQFEEANQPDECVGPASYQSMSSLSWVKVSAEEAEPTKWVPDHAAPNCYGCDQAFWLANRRHHCRNCGQVFCWSCSNYTVPVPNEQLMEPVRVCSRCFDILDGHRYQQNCSANTAE